MAGFSIAFSARRTKLFRWLVSQTAVWTNGVVVNTPSLDLAPGICNRHEPMFIETCVPKLAVVAFNEGVLGRLARLDKVKLHTGTL